MSETGETSSKSLKAEELREALEAVIAKKGRHYSNLATFSLRFSADNTQAMRDSQKFIDFATSIEIETKHDLNERVCIQPDDNLPGRTFTQKLFTLSENIGKYSGRTLLLFHYAGHGSINRYNELELYAEIPEKNPILYHQTVHTTLVDPIQYVSHFLIKTDVIILLDCCFSGIAIRGSTNSDRIVEVISVVGANQRALGNEPSQDQRVSAITFTTRVMAEISYRHKEGATRICFAEIVQKLRERASLLRGPQYKLMVGTQAIQVPLKFTALPPLGHNSRRHPTLSSDSSSSEQAMLPVPTATAPALRELRVLVQVHVNSEREGAGVDSLLSWFEGREQGFSIELIDVFETDSSLILFTVPWSIWVQIETSQEPSFVMMGEVWGRGLCNHHVPPSLSRGGDHLSLRQSNSPTRGVKSSRSRGSAFLRENIPPSRGSAQDQNN